MGVNQRTGLLLTFLGLLLVIAGVTWLWGPAALCVAGGFVSVLGVVVDWDRT